MRSFFKFFIALVLGFLLLLAGCRAGSLDPDKVKVYPDKPSAYPFDQFQDYRPAEGTGQFMAGAATVDISPYNYRVWISGFGCGRISTGVRDPVYARALFLDDGVRSLVFLSLDLTGLMKPDIDRIRALVTEKYPDRIIIGSTHNHQAPDTVGYWGFGIGFPLETGIVEAYQQEMIHKSADCINQAIRNATSARLKFGTVTIPPGYSANLWFPEDENAKDNEMSVMRAETLSGKPISTMINWPCHAEAQLGKGHKISAEFPGQFYREMESLGGGVGIFFQGALGGMIIPIINGWDIRKQYNLEERLEFNEKLGKLLAEKANEALQASKPLSISELRFDVLRKDIQIPVESFVFTLAGKTGIIRDADRIADENNRIVETEVYAIRLGPATFVTIPGEIFPSIGFALKEQMKSRHKFILGLTSDELGYMMTFEEFQDKTYKYERSVSMGPMTGRIVRDAIRELLTELDQRRSKYGIN